MFLLGIDWPAAIDALAFGGAACLGASYVGSALIDAAERMKKRPSRDLLPASSAEPANQVQR